MISFDTEDNSQGDVTLINFFDGVKHYTFDIKDYKNQYNLKRAAIRFIFKSGEKLFSAHNLEYDLINIFYPHQLKLLTLFYSNRLIFAKINDTHIKFIDSFNFSFTALKFIGDEIGLSKLDNKKDFYNIEYNRRDTEIVYKYLDELFLNLKNEFNIKPKLTLAGTSQKIFLEKFCEYKVTGINMENEILNAYYGGRCELFHYGKINNFIFEIDVNSMYPYVMKSFDYPISEGIKTVNPISHFFISHVWIKINKNISIPVLPCRQDRLYFPVGSFDTWITSEELIFAKQLKQVEDIEYIETYNFIDRKKIFSSFVDYFYMKRFKAKEDNNNFLSNYYKRLLNAVYGRFALKSSLQIITAENNPSYEKFIDRKILKNNMVEIQANFPSKNINYGIPLFVTAYSRIVLYNLFLQIKKLKGKIIYCDTDSVYFYFNYKIDLEKTKQKLNKLLPINNTLGALSLNVYKSGMFENCKAYLLNTLDNEDKIKLKGIPKDKRADFLQAGHTTYKRPMKLRPSFKSVDNIPANFWNDFYIEKKGSYKKRIINNDNSTRPIKL